MEYIYIYGNKVSSLDVSLTWYFMVVVFFLNLHQASANLIDLPI